MKKIIFVVNNLSKTTLVEVANWIWPVFDSFSKVKSINDFFVLKDVYSNEQLNSDGSKEIKDNLIMDYFNLKLNKNDAFVCVVKLP